jgi:sulfate permease, SulP family
MPITSAISSKFKEALAGLTVAFALIPEALAFAVVAGLPPLTGLYAAFTVGFITSAFGTRAGMISGATGAVAVVLAPVAAQLGTEAVFITVIGAGCLQIIGGLGGLGRHLHIRSKPVISGFLNGLAIILFASQVGQFRYAAGNHTSHWLQGTQLLSTSLLVFLAIAVVMLLPRLSKAVPSSLAAILLVFVLAPECHH